MKKIAFILLVLSFFVQSTSQLWIMAAFKINQDYIAANLCVNRFEAIPVCKGSCYLENQLEQNQKQQEKFPDLKIKEINLFCKDHSTNLATQVANLNSKVSYAQTDTPFLTSDYLRSVFRPPSFAV